MGQIKLGIIIDNNLVVLSVKIQRVAKFASLPGNPPAQVSLKCIGRGIICNGSGCLVQGEIKHQVIIAHRETQTDSCQKQCSDLYPKDLIQNY